MTDLGDTGVILPKNLSDPVSYIPVLESLLRALYKQRDPVEAEKCKDTIPKTNTPTASMNVSKSLSKCTDRQLAMKVLNCIDLVFHTIQLISEKGKNFSGVELDDFVRVLRLFTEVTKTLNGRIASPSTTEYALRRQRNESGECTYTNIREIRLAFEKLCGVKPERRESKRFVKEAVGDAFRTAGPQKRSRKQMATVTPRKTKPAKKVSKVGLKHSSSVAVPLFSPTKTTKVKSDKICATLFSVYRPEHGPRYTRDELARILLQLQHKFTFPLKTVFRELHGKGWLPRHYNANSNFDSAYRALQRDLDRLKEFKARGNISMTLTRKGRFPLLSTQQLHALATRNGTLQSGEVMKGKELKEKVKEALQLEHKLKGFAGKAKEPHPRTVKNYEQQVLSTNPHIRDLTGKKVKTKDDKRVQAEHSLRSLATELVTVASTHFIPILKSDLQRTPRIYCASLPDPDDELTKQIQKYWGADYKIFCVLPTFFINTDDTTVWTFKGEYTDESESQWTFENDSDSAQQKVLDRAKGKSRTLETSQSVYVRSEEDNNTCKGMRVRFTVSANANGECAPITITISGLSSTELTRDDVEYVIFPAFHGREAVHLIFARKKSEAKNDEFSPDMRCFHTYRQKIFIPWIRTLHERFGIYDNDTVPEWARTVSWIDGALFQVQVVEKEDKYNIFEQLRLVTNKGAAARTGTSQELDAGRLFPNLKHFVRKHTVRTPIETYLAPLVKNFLKDLKFLSLSAGKLDALVNLICHISRSMKSASTKVTTISRGFERTGKCVPRTTPSGTLFSPGYEEMVATVRNAKLEDTHNITENFQKLLQEQFEKGRVSDETLKKFHIGDDSTEKNRDVDCTSHQRALTISSKGQRHHRSYMLEQRSLKRKLEQEKQNRCVLLVLKSIPEIKSKVLKKSTAEKLKDATLEDFGVLKRVEMQLFVAAHTCTNHDEWKLFLQKKFKKGSKSQVLDSRDSDEGKKYLWTQAYECRNKKVILKTSRNSTSNDDRDEEITLPLTSVFQLWSTCELDAGTLLDNKFWCLNIWKQHHKISQSTRNLRSNTARDEEIIPVLRNKDKLTKAKAAARQFQRILEKRVRLLMSTKLKDEMSRQRAWGFKFVLENSAQLSARAILLEHIHFDLDHIIPSDCLLNMSVLRNDVNSSTEKDTCGTYLYYDSKREVFIRSGMTMKSFIERFKQHEKKSKIQNMTDIENLFYQSYPWSTCAKNVLCQNQIRGFHEVLKASYPFVIPTDRSKVCDFLVQDYANEDGAFAWTKDVINKMEECSFNNAKDIRHKKLYMLSYMFEVMYECCLSPVHNVSGSPGFEFIHRNLAK